ncbi:hypothetical protein KP509_02G029900 [Ceratopteris richardii]|nr:hypothetical protein KP509_02G029900 [Ceratopteris richardii]
MNIQFAILNVLMKGKFYEVKPVGHGRFPSSNQQLSKSIVPLYFFRLFFSTGTLMRIRISVSNDLMIVTSIINYSSSLLLLPSHRCL